MHLNLEIWPEYLSISMYVLDVALRLPLHVVGHQFNYINCWLGVWFDCFLVAIYSYFIVVLGGLCREEKPLFTRWVPLVETATSLSTRGTHLFFSTQLFFFWTCFSTQLSLVACLEINWNKEENGGLRVSTLTHGIHISEFKWEPNMGLHMRMGPKDPTDWSSPVFFFTKEIIFIKTFW